jgi:predicted enzyme related to lactoylglutathione lyase
LSRIVLMVRGSEGVASAVNFYHKAIGLQVLRVTDDWAELATTTGNNAATTVLTVQSVVANEAQLSTAYSPWLTFTVEKMDETVAACVQAGAQLDGPIQYPAHGTVALLRSPDNHMIGLYEPNKYAATSRQALQSTPSGKR